MDTQTLIHVALIQTEGAGYSLLVYLSVTQIWFACPYFILGPCSFFPLAFFLFHSQVGHYFPTGKPLPHPQKETACIVMSQDSGFVGGLSIFKV